MRPNESRVRARECVGGPSAFAETELGEDLDPAGLEVLGAHRAGLASLVQQPELLEELVLAQRSGVVLGVVSTHASVGGRASLAARSCLASSR